MRERDDEKSKERMMEYHTVSGIRPEKPIQGNPLEQKSLDFRRDLNDRQVYFPFYLETDEDKKG